VGENEQAVSQGKRTWRRRAAIALAVFSALLLIFHRPLLLTLGERVAARLAAKEHLKLNCRLEGNVFTQLIARNVHVTATGPSLVESIDAEFVRVDYTLWGLIRHGTAGGLRDGEVRAARVVLDPAKDEHKPKTGKKETLYDIFPDRVRITGGTLIIRDTPHNFVAEQIDLALDPKSPGELRVAKLQMIGGQNWSNLTARTSYAGKNIALTNGALGDDRIELATIDASHVGEKREARLAVNLKALVGGGEVSGSMKFVEKGSLIFQETEVKAKQVEAGALDKYFNLPEGIIGGKIDQLSGHLAGNFDRPDTWLGGVSAQISQFKSPAGGFDQGKLDVWAKDGKAGLKTADIVVGESRLQFSGSMILPRNTDDFPRSPGHLEISSETFDLARASEGMPQHISGSAQFTGKIEIKDAKLAASLNVSASAVGFEQGTVEKLTANVTMSKTMPRAGARKPWFADLRSDAVVEASNVRFREYALDSVHGALQSTDDRLKIQQLLMKRRQNELAIHGEYRLPADVGKALHQPGAIELALNAPELADYWETDSPNKISGPLQGNGQVDWKEGAGNGQLSIYGANLRMRNLVLKQVTSQCSMANSVVYVNDLTAALNERDSLGAHGSIDLRPPFRYAGKISTNIADLSTFKPVLQVSGNKSELGGTFVMNWEGNGDLRTMRNSGKLNLSLEKGRYGTLQSLRAKVDASYSPEGLDVPIISLASERMDFQAVAQAKGERFEISKIQLDQGKDKYASGYVSIPFVWKNLDGRAPLFPPNGKVAVNFQSESIEIKKLFEDFGLKTATSGVMNVKVDARGTLEQLDASFDFEARDLRSETVPNLEPATFKLSGQTKDNQLKISGKLQQSKIQPVELTATLPFDAARVLSEHRLPDDTPVTGKVRLPRSSVNFLRQFVPQVVQLDGDLALDVDVRGTIAQPVLSGAGDITINVARAENVTLPALRDFKARILFANDSLKVEQFRGDLSGGKFTLTGGVKFTKLTEANIDLQLKANSVLVARNDTVTARTDADIKVVGRFMSATVSGTVALTNSQFLKNLDLIPIGLPGRPAPQPPESRPEFSFPDPPLRDWKFDVAIKTKDPFLLRGNLARGGAVSDLRLIGTGLHPGLEGVIRLENVEATLPFSRLEISHGFLYFDPSDSLNPKIDMHGTSVIRDYTIHVYIYGTTLAPQAIFTSEPPLPQEEIISLLATGATREQLAGNSDVLAGRAAMLLVQQLYRKIFKQGEGTQNTSVFDRLDMDVGQINPRTGQRQATARFKINDQFVLVGDVDVGGGFRGMVKYLIRFR
jgi:TamB, inner membrane protein subunit of TAM complex